MKPTKHRAKSRKGMITRTIALDPAMRRQLAIAGLDAGLTVNELLRQIIREWFARQRTKTSRRTT